MLHAKLGVRNIVLRKKFIRDSGSYVNCKPNALNTKFGEKPSGLPERK
jgi:hypothetical protein